MSEPCSPPSPTSAGAEWGILLLLAAVQFTNILDFVIIMPIAPWAKERFHIDSRHFGNVVAAYGFASFAGSILAAKFLDRFGRKQALLTLYLGFTLSTLLCGLAPTYGLAARGPSIDRPVRWRRRRAADGHHWRCVCRLSPWHRNGRDHVLLRGGVDRRFADRAAPRRILRHRWRRSSLWPVLAASCGWAFQALMPNLPAHPDASHLIALATRH